MSIAQFLLLNTAMVCCFSSLAVYSASALKGHDLAANPYLFLIKHTSTLVAGFLLILILRFIPRTWFRKLPPLLFLGSFSALLAIFIPGIYSEAGGASRWINLGVARFQPSELAKIAVVFCCARILSTNASDPRFGRKCLLPIAAMLLLYASVLLVQPDFGSAALIVFTGVGLLFMAGMSLKICIPAGFLALSCGAVLIATSPYRLERIISFLDPWSDRHGGGFQIIQGYLAFYNGGLWGTGLGESKQKLFFLPEAHTDFILPLIGEEFGAFGAILVSLLLLNILRAGFLLSRRLKDPFEAFLSLGISLLFTLQTAFNVSVALGMIPTKGIPLPLVSSGSSSLISTLFMVGVLHRLAAAPTEKSFYAEDHQGSHFLLRHLWERYAALGRTVLLQRLRNRRFGHRL